MKVIAIKPNPNDWKKPIYIASFDKVAYDENGEEIRVYKKPVRYDYNYQPVSSYLDIQAFGKDAIFTQKMVIPESDKKLFKEYDVAYLNGTVPYNLTSDTEYQQDMKYYKKDKEDFIELIEGTDYEVGDEISEELYNEEEEYGYNANYVLLPPKIGNAVVIIYCQKIRGK